MPDFSRFQNAYENAPVGGGGQSKGTRTEVPDGSYQVRVDRVELKTSQSGNDMLDWELTILGPRQQGRKMWRKNMLSSDENIKFLKGDLYVCGVTLGHINDINNESTLRKLIGVNLEVTKKTKGEYSNVYLNRKVELEVEPQPQRRAAFNQPPADDGYGDDGVPF